MEKKKTAASLLISEHGSQYLRIAPIDNIVAAKEKRFTVCNVLFFHKFK